MVEAVVWDIGNVLAIWDPEGYYDRLIGPERRERLFQEANLHEMNVAVDLGANGREAAYARAEEFPHWAAEIRRWHDDWAETFRQPVEGAADLLHATKARGIRTVALSNFGAETIEIARDIHPVLREFDQEFISAHLGVVKPDPAIYEALEQGTGLSGDALLFTDDKPENIAAAAARGWKTHLFEGADGWRDRLIAEGLLEA